jgi:ParB/RepB/Spo0J family partition protein
MGAGMTRKHVFPPLPSPGAAARPADSSAPRPRTGPVGAIGRIMGEMRDESERAAALLGQIESAERVVEIAPALIDPSPIRDRIDDPAATEDAELRASIAEHGQQVPVLLRPGAGGRYVTVFGHRRVAALRALGRPVRAVVSDLSEREALVVQGQENNERKNTSFIERCLYARRLEEAGLSGQDIAAATGVAKSMASMMNVITQHIPEPLIRAIGPALDGAGQALRGRRARRREAVARLRRGGGVFRPAERRALPARRRRDGGAARAGEVHSCEPRRPRGRLWRGQAFAPRRDDHARPRRRRRPIRRPQLRAVARKPAARAARKLAERRMNKFERACA